MASPLGFYPELLPSHPPNYHKQPTLKKTAPSEPKGLVTYIFHDLHAVDYFKDAFAGEFYMMEETSISGIDIYMVEQWVIDRKIGTVVAAYTGNVTNRVRAVKFRVEKKQSRHYPVKFQEYINWLAVNHARMKLMEEPRNDSQLLVNLEEHNQEVCFVTNLASLPLYLNLIPIPDGDVRKVSTNFVINSNLKRLRCSGRSMLLITPKISDANVDKFRQIYRICNANIPCQFSVRELVNVIQISLWYFGLLDINYADGLLCRKTEEAISNWWTRVAMVHLRHVKKQPESEGILPADTVAAIIGMVLLCRMRLNMVGCDPPKDPYDFENFVHTVTQFQKLKNLPVTKKLDLETLQRLFELTSTKVISNNKPVISIDDDDEERMPYLSKKNRHYYSKELKKFTNVVKNTVQDHINAAGSKEEDMINSKSGVMIRNKISKLAEPMNPADVEALKLDTLVKGYLPGKTLNRLFYGVTKSSLSNLPIDMNGHIRGSQLMQLKNSYEFMSLYLKVLLWGPLFSEGQAGDLLKYSRGLKRMGLKKTSSLVRPMVTETESKTQESVHVTAPDIIQDDAGDSKSTTTTVSYRPLTHFRNALNRRNSYPFSAQEINLNMLEHTKLDVNHDAKVLDTHIRLVRSQSCSEIEEYILRPAKSTTNTMTKFSLDYLQKVELFIRYLSLRKLYDSDFSADACACTTNANVVRNFGVLNHDLYRLQTAYSQMTANKSKIIDEELQGKLEYQINQLNSTVDRLDYELRLVDKRVDEFEKLTNDLEMVVTNHQKRLTHMAEGVVNSEGFFQVCPSRSERRDIEVKLLGKPINHLNTYTMESEPQSTWMTSFFLMVYNAFAYLSQLLHFDRANMNIDRIRKSWIKVDPNRTIINRAYSMVGKRPSRNSVALSKPNQMLGSDNHDDCKTLLDDNFNRKPENGSLHEHFDVDNEEDPLFESSQVEETQKT